jgi:hypothetical protein
MRGVEAVSIGLTHAFCLYYALSNQSRENLADALLRESVQDTVNLAGGKRGMVRGQDSKDVTVKCWCHCREWSVQLHEADLLSAYPVLL